MDCSLASTQEICTQESEEPNNDAWGRILPIVDKYPCVELIKPNYSFGRCADIVLNLLCPFFNTISKVHFEIVKENDVVSLKDQSQNGTFVNGARIGRGNSKILKSNDEIALSSKINKAFIFIDLKNNETLYPPEVTNKYTIGRKIGGGACGEVRLGFRNDSHAKVAVKIIKKKSFDILGKTPNFESEVKILRQLNHPCIVKLEDAIDTDSTLYIFLELVEGGELFDRIVYIKQFPEKDCKVIFYQMVLAIKYLHDNNVSHRDLKPENILLATNDNLTLIKVTDFGLSKLVNGQTMLKTLCGTPNYLAPEVILSTGDIGYTFACDVWSLGVILFICLVGYPPFTEERTDFSLKEQIIHGRLDFPPMYWNGVSNEAISLLRAMLQVDPNNRITVSKMLEHPWLQDPAMRAIVKKIMYPLADVSLIDDATLPSNDINNETKNLEEADQEEKNIDAADEPITKRRKLNGETI